MLSNSLSVINSFTVNLLSACAERYTDQVLEQMSRAHAFSKLYLHSLFKFTLGL